MLLREIENYRNELVDFLMHPDRMEMHHLVILCLIAGYALSSVMSAMPRYARPLCRYVMLVALVLALRVDIVDAVPDHGDLFAEISDSLRKVVR